VLVLGGEVGALHQGALRIAGCLLSLSSSRVRSKGLQIEHVLRLLSTEILVALLHDLCVLGAAGAAAGRCAATGAGAGVFDILSLVWQAVVLSWPRSALRGRCAAAAQPWWARRRRLPWPCLALLRPLALTLSVVGVSLFLRH
jgi:hypothetical protein